MGGVGDLAQGLFKFGLAEFSKHLRKQFAGVGLIQGIEIHAV
jgi:hypothetical protein